MLINYSDIISTFVFIWFCFQIYFVHIDTLILDDHSVDKRRSKSSFILFLFSSSFFLSMVRFFFLRYYCEHCVMYKSMTHPRCNSMSKFLFLIHFLCISLTSKNFYLYFSCRLLSFACHHHKIGYANITDWRLKFVCNLNRL